MEGRKGEWMDQWMKDGWVVNEWMSWMNEWIGR